METLRTNAHATLEENLVASLACARGLDGDEGDLVVGLEAAGIAGHFLIDQFGVPVEVSEKARGQVVSPLDEQCDEKIHAYISSRRPHDQYLSEEGHPDTKFLTGRRTWVVDPLDGTIYFTPKDRVLTPYNLQPENLELPCVMVALAEGTRLRLSVILFPMTGEIFYATEESNAFKNGEIIQLAHPRITLEDGTVALNRFSAKDTSRRMSEMDAIANHPGVRSKEYEGNSGMAKFLFDPERQIAAIAHANGLVNAKDYKRGSWDEAWELIVRRAGGTVRQFDGGDFDIQRRAPLIYAANEQVANELIGIMRDQRDGLRLAVG